MADQNKSFAGLPVTGKELPEGYRLYALTAEEYDPLDFAMHQLTLMIDDVHRKYYAVLEGERCTS